MQIRTSKLSVVALGRLTQKNMSSSPQSEQSPQMFDHSGVGYSVWAWIAIGWGTEVVVSNESRLSFTMSSTWACINRITTTSILTPGHCVCPHVLPWVFTMSYADAINIIAVYFSIAMTCKAIWRAILVGSVRLTLPRTLLYDFPYVGMITELHWSSFHTDAGSHVFWAPRFFGISQWGFSYQVSRCDEIQSMLFKSLMEVHVCK